MKALFLAAALAQLAAPFAACPAMADVVVAARLLRAQSVIGPDDVKLAPEDHPGALGALRDAIGMETERALFPDQPIVAKDLVAPAAVERNQPVEVVFTQGALRISVEGRSLDRAAVGRAVRVMNAGSKTILRAVVTGAGAVAVPSNE